MRLWQDIWDVVASLFGFGVPVFRTVYTDDLPEFTDKRTLYVVGENDDYWCITFECPCGCGETIQISLLAGKPRWHFKKHWNGLITVSPSVWRTKGCRSHFFIRRNRVVWCPTSNTQL